MTDDLRARARSFVDQVLIPLEVKAERAGGRLPEDDVARIRSEALARRLRGGSHAAEHGGQGWTTVEWFLVEEQFGRSTNALSCHIPTAYNVLAHGSPEQIDRWLRPELRGELHDAYAVTEEHAGSDPSAIASTATPVSGGWRIDGEKWFVTYGSVAAVFIVMAKAPDGPTLFLVEADRPGVSVVDDPPFTHTYPHGHPTIRFDGVEVPRDAVVGSVGGGEDLQRAWFTEERLGIAARGARPARHRGADRPDGRQHLPGRGDARPDVGAPPRAAHADRRLLTRLGRCSRTRASACTRN
jgi:acyl-CoA dehydrogenase